MNVRTRFQCFSFFETMLLFKLRAPRRKADIHRLPYRYLKKNRRRFAHSGDIVASVGQKKKYYSKKDFFEAGSFLVDNDLN